MRERFKAKLNVAISRDTEMQLPGSESALRQKDISAWQKWKRPLAVILAITVLGASLILMQKMQDSAGLAQEAIGTIMMLTVRQ